MLQSLVVSIDMPSNVGVVVLHQLSNTPIVAKNSIRFPSLKENDSYNTKLNNYINSNPQAVVENLAIECIMTVITQHEKKMTINKLLIKKQTTNLLKKLIIKKNNKNNQRDFGIMILILL